MMGFSFRGLLADSLFCARANQVRELRSLRNSRRSFEIDGNNFAMRIDRFAQGLLGKHPSDVLADLLGVQC